MSAFGGLIITNKGRNLQAKAQLGAQLNFTRIAVGDGDLGGSSIVDLNVLKHQVMSMGVSKVKTLAGGKALIGTVLSNQELVDGFYFKELGVFAQDPDLGEILYCYGNAGANAEYISAGGGPDIVEKSIDIITLVGNAANISATIDESLVFASAAELNNHLLSTANPHQVTTAQIGAETPAGAQAKADAAAAAGVAAAGVVQDNLDAHATALDPHSQYATSDELAVHTGAAAPHAGHETPGGAQAKVDAHANRTDNPHGVTTAQIGAETPAGAQAKVNAHANRIDNPHAVTPAQIGAETPAGAQTKADAAAAAGIAAAGVVQDDLNTVKGAGYAGETVKALADAQAAHLADTANPHQVTKAQVGLGSVDNVKQLPIAGGTMTGQLKMQNNTAYTTFQGRNIVLSTGDPSGGGNGDIWIKYTA